MSTPPPRSSGRRPVPVPSVEVNTRPFADTRTTRSRWETDSGPGGTRREGPPPSPPPGLWRRRSRRRRSPSPAFSRSERGNGAAPPPLRVCSGRFAGCSDEESCLPSFRPRLPSRRKAEVAAAVSESSEARQKFANAKAISSDMFFGRESSTEVLQRASTQSMLRLWPHADPDFPPLASMKPRRDWRTCPAAPPSAQPTCLVTPMTLKVRLQSFVVVCQPVWPKFRVRATFLNLCFYSFLV